MTLTHRPMTVPNYSQSHTNHSGMTVRAVLLVAGLLVIMMIAMQMIMMMWFGVLSPLSPAPAIVVDASAVDDASVAAAPADLVNDIG